MGANRHPEAEGRAGGRRRLAWGQRHTAAAAVGVGRSLGHRQAVLVGCTAVAAGRAAEEEHELEQAAAVHSRRSTPAPAAAAAAGAAAG